jgi:hypothetical protein
MAVENFGKHQLQGVMQSTQHHSGASSIRVNAAARNPPQADKGDIKCQHLTVVDANAAR